MQIYEIDRNNSNNVSKDDIMELLFDNSRDMYESMIREINYLWGIYYYGPREADRYNTILNIIQKRCDIIYQFKDEDDYTMDIQPEVLQRCKEYFTKNNIILCDPFIESLFSDEKEYIKDAMNKDFFFSSDYNDKIDILRILDEDNYYLSINPNYNCIENRSESIIKTYKMLRDGTLNIRWYNKDTPEDKDNIIYKI